MTTQPHLFRADGLGGWVTFRHEIPDLPDCGTAHPSLPRACVLDPGHDGPHFDAGVSWTSPRCAQCARRTDPDGRHLPEDGGEFACPRTADASSPAPERN